MPEVEIPHPHEVHEKAENPFTKAVALAVAVYAVGLAFATFGGHNAAKEMMMAKAEESNQWNRYRRKARHSFVVRARGGRGAVSTGQGQTARRSGQGRGPDGG